MGMKMKFKDKDGIIPNFCPVPFTTLFPTKNGSIGCCRNKWHHHVGNIEEQSLREIWNGEEIRKWRREFLTGDIRICKQEMKERSCHLQYQKNLNHITQNLHYAEVMDSSARRLSLSLNGKCNLKCIMCLVWTGQNGKYDTTQFWEEGEKYIFPHLHEIDMLSGEPFVQRDTYRLIDIMSKVNPECAWTFTTNAHWIFNKTIEKYLNKIKIKLMVISIDSLKVETFAKIRRGGKLQTVLRNVKKIEQYNRDKILNGKNPFEISMNFVIQKANWKELKELIEFADNIGAYPSPMFLHGPDKTLSLLSCSEIQKLDILEWYFDNLDPRQLLISKQIMIAIIESLSPLERGQYWLSLREKLLMVKKNKTS